MDGLRTPPTAQRRTTFLHAAGNEGVLLIKLWPQSRCLSVCKAFYLPSQELKHPEAKEVLEVLEIVFAHFHFFKISCLPTFGSHEQKLLGEFRLYVRCNLEGQTIE